MIGVLGASGFIGRSLTDRMGADGTDYVALLRDPNSVPPEAFPNARRVTAFEIGGDMDPVAFDGIDTLLLATSATKPNLRYNGLVNEVQKNVLPHCQLLTALEETDVRHLIFLSSGGAVYGDVDQTDAIDESHPCHPCTPYGYGKLCIEAAIAAQWIGPGRRHTILRPSNPVGPYQMQSLGAHGLFPTVFHNIMHDQPVHVFGDGSTIRDYFSIHDLNDLILAVAADPGQANSVINASSGHGLSIADVIHTCAHALGKEPEIVYQPEKQPRIGFNVLSNTRAQTLFGWRPSRSVQDIARDLKDVMGRH